MQLLRHNAPPEHVQPVQPDVLRRHTQPVRHDLFPKNAQPPPPRCALLEHVQPPLRDVPVRFDVFTEHARPLCPDALPGYVQLPRPAAPGLLSKPPSRLVANVSSDLHTVIKSWPEARISRTREKCDSFYFGR